MKLVTQVSQNNALMLWYFAEHFQKGDKESEFLLQDKAYYRKIN